MPQYFSAKPDYQRNAGSSSPKWGATAVFEWEDFSSLQGDFSEDALNRVYMRISRDIIERPYHYDAHQVYDAKGNTMSFVHTDANNIAPPRRIKGGVLYKQNHGTGHALRQMVSADKLIDVMVTEGNAHGKSMDEVGCDKSNTVMIGDSRCDFEAALNANIDFIGIHLRDETLLSDVSKSSNFVADSIASLDSFLFP